MRRAWKRPLGSMAQREVLGHEIDIEQAAGQMLEIPRALGRRVAGDAVAHVGDVAEHPLGLVRVGADQVLRGGRLHHHSAHRVRDDVVQLAGDPVAFGVYDRRRDG